MRRDEFTALKEQKVALLNEMRNLESAANSTSVNNENGEWLAEDVEKFEKLTAEIRSINLKLERAHQLMELETARGIEIPLDSNTSAPKSYNEYRMAGGVGRPWDMAEVREATFKYWVTGEFALEPEERRALSKATGPAGSYLVPTGFENELVRSLRWLGSFGSLAREIVTSTGEAVQVPQNSAHGTAAWLSEGGSFTDVEADETFGQGVLQSYKAACKIRVSEELLQDAAFGLDQFLATEFGERIAVLAEAAYIHGDGVGKPTGLAHPTKGYTSYTFPVGQVAATSYDALVAVKFALPPQYRPGASWLLSDGMAERLYLLKDSQNRPLYVVNLAADAPDTLLGHPVYSHPNLDAPGANALSVVFGNHQKAYWTRRVEGVSIQRQNELHSDQGQVGFRGYLRLDGMPVLPDAGRIVKFDAT